MQITWGLAIGGAFGVGAVMAACGSGGATGATSGGPSGTGGATATSGTGLGGGLGFDAGPHDAAAQDGDACGNVTLTQHKTPGNIVVVFDQSNSMHKPFSMPDGGAGGPKWQVAEDALVAAVTPSAGILNLGAIFFPTKATADGCGKVALIGGPQQIPIEPGASFVTDFQGHFSAPGWTLILGTPLKNALDHADLALPDPSPLQGQRAVVIITDGAPTCITMTSAILAPVQAMFARGIKTYALGLPGSAGAASLLDQIAMAGGTTQYLSPADPAALQAALAQIASDTIDQCTITLDPAPSDPSKVHLLVTDSGKPKGYEITEADGGDGWSLSADGTTATLLGAVCAKAKSGGYTSIQFVYGCPSGPN